MLFYTLYFLDQSAVTLVHLIIYHYDFCALPFELQFFLRRGLAFI